MYLFYYFIILNITISPNLHGKYSSVDQEKGLIIFVHGLTASMDESIILYGEQFFNNNSYSTFRFNLYGDGKDEKKLQDVSLKDHIIDINAVIDYFVQQGHENIILIGHSFGGLSLLYSNLSHIQKIILWDASIGGEELLGDVYKDNKGRYIDWGDNYKRYIDEQMYQDFCINSNTHLSQIQKILMPIVIIAAEYGLLEPAKEYAKVLGQEVNIVEGAGHTFDTQEHRERLFETTLQNL